MKKKLKEEIKKDLKVRDIEEGEVVEERIHNKWYKDRGFWNEFDGEYQANKSTKKYLEESELKIYDFKFYGIDRIKKDFDYKLWEKISMFLTELYNEHYNRYKFKDWKRIYMDADRIRLYLGKDYNKILDKLDKLGVIDLDKKINQHNAYQYVKYIGLSDGFRNVKGELFEEVNMTSESFQNSIFNYYYKKINNREGVEKFVEKVLDNSSFELSDIKRAELDLDIAESKFEEEINRLQSNYVSDKEKEEIKLNLEDKDKFIEDYLMYASHYYDGYLRKMNCIEGKRRFNYGIKVDEYGKRLSHIVSNMPKRYRKHLKIDEEEVVEVDIVSSQVAFLTILLNKLFNSEEDFNENNESSFGGVRISELKKEVSDKVRSPFILMDKLSMFYSEDNVKSTHDLDLYKYMSMKLVSLKSIGDTNVRTDMKGVFMGLLFGSTKFEKYKGKNRKQIIDNVFGYDFFELLQSIERLDVEGIEKKKYRNLSALLQREESKFLNEVMAELMKDEVKFLPLYDCLITKKRDKERVEEAFNSVISKNGYVGIIKVK